MSTSEAVTEGIRIEVASHYSRGHSNAGQWFFLYTVRISNEGSQSVQLMSRHWVIRDATGSIQEVRGPGVVGEGGLVPEIRRAGHEWGSLAGGTLGGALNRSTLFTI